MISYLIYRSHRRPNCTESEIDKIIEACKRNNAGQDITGVLLYTDNTFVQYLEGSYREIMDLYDKIKTDERHNKVAMLGGGSISERIFPSWHMGRKDIQASVDFKTDISKEDEKTFQEVLTGSNEDSNKAISLIRKLAA